MPNSNHDDPLSRTLASWRVEPRRNPQFRADVLARIDRASAGRPARTAAGAPAWPTFAHAHAGFIGVLIAAAIVAGALTGRVEAHHRADADRSLIAATYVHSLDARWMRHP